MTRLSRTAIALPLSMLLWVFLAGADRGCFYVEPECAGLTEEACLEDDSCQPVYLYLNYEGLDCLGGRCMGEEPVFDRCEDKPDCSALGEEACLTDSACQAIYGYGDEMYDDMLNGTSPRCAPGARCIMPPETFLECLDADANPCTGHTEEECWQRPMCQADYSYPRCDEERCDGEAPVYEGCSLVNGQCQTADDCYILNGDWDMPNCPGFHFTCEAGQCVEHCESTGCFEDADCAADEFCSVFCDEGWCEGTCLPRQTGCEDDSQCAEGEFCEVRCGNGWCEGVCIPEQNGCLTDTDCAAGEMCLLPPCECPDGEDCDCLGAGVCVPQETACLTDADCAAGEMCLLAPCECPPGEDCDCLGAGVCVADETYCESNADCQEGFYCQFDDWCDEGWCGSGTCQPAHTGCIDDEQCAPGETCEIYCGNGWCEGVCEGQDPACESDADCQEGQYCQAWDYAGCDFGAPCPGTCQEGVWTLNQPVQCGGNSWELDSVENPERYLNCMVDCLPDMDCGNGWEEICRIETYFLHQGILLHDVRDVYGSAEVCAACSCLRGDTVYALVAPADVERMLGFGFLPM